MQIKQVFKSTISSCKYIFKSGKEASFINSEYYTDDDVEISELTKEINLKHPHIFRDENKLTVDTDNLDPLAYIKKKAIEEYLAQGSNTGIANSASIIQAAKSNAKG